MQVLQVRQKWVRNKLNIQGDDAVLLKDGNIHRCQWPLARVLEAIASKDGLVRKIKLLIADSKMDNKGKRLSPFVQLDQRIHKLVSLFSQDNQN